MRAQSAPSRRSSFDCCCVPDDGRYGFARLMSGTVKMREPFEGASIASTSADQLASSGLRSAGRLAARRLRYTPLDNPAAVPAARQPAQGWLDSRADQTAAAPAAEGGRR
jgi:hypothetical protein